MARQPARVLRSDRFASRRKEVRRTRQRRRRRTAFTIVALTGLALGGWMLSRSSLFALEGIEVSGTQLLTKAEVIHASGLRTGRNMLSLDLAALEARLARLPLVASVDITKPTPSRIRIAVEERSPAFVLETTEGRWFLGGDATTLLPVGPTRPASLPMIRIAREVSADTGDRVRAPDVVAALDLWRALPEWLRAGAPIIDASPAGMVLVRSELSIRFGTLDRLDEKLTAVAAVIARAKGARARLAMIDVRSPARPAAQMT